MRSLPPRTTCELQPCDQGLISSIKAQWRSQLDEHMVSVKSAADVAKHARTFSLAKVMEYVSQCVSLVPREVGKKYWRPLLGHHFLPPKEVMVDSAESQMECEDMAELDKE